MHRPSPRTGLLLAAVAVLFAAGLSTSGCAPAPSGSASGATPGTPATGSAVATTAQPATAWPKVAFTPVASGFTRPVYVASANDGSGRLFVVEQGGRIMVVKGGKVLPTPFLDISAKVSGKNEQGLLGLAFAPSYAKSGRFYVEYTDANGDTVVARISSDPAADTAKAGTEQRVLFVKQPYANHNGGCLQFGPDGLLYIGMGDGGSGGDPQKRAQNKDELLGKMLRIDTERKRGIGSSPGDYAIPPGNPFVSIPGFPVRPEIFQLGLRNPWRFSFDRATGDLYIGDVGQNAWEEIDFAPRGVGGQNFGWNLWEGDHPYPAGANPPRAGFTFPIAEYPHPEGEAVIGGYVYRGTKNPTWVGTYFYADEVTTRLWALGRGNDMGWHSSVIGDTGRTISSFGEDEAGELYVTDLKDGTLYRMDPAK